MTAIMTIGQAAKRSGFSPSALRYYERHGLVKPSGRTNAGYRFYNQVALDRLTFIARAKQLGCSLHDIVELLSVFDTGSCRSTQEGLHTLVGDKIAEAQKQLSELTIFIEELQSASAHLGQPAVDGPCAPTCACLSQPGQPTTPAAIKMGHKAVQK